MHDERLEGQICDLEKKNDFFEMVHKKTNKEGCFGFRCKSEEGALEFCEEFSRWQKDFRRYFVYSAGCGIRVIVVDPTVYEVVPTQREAVAGGGGR